MYASTTPAPAARILSLVAALTLGAVAYCSGIAIRRSSLLTYQVAGFSLDLAEVPAEVEYLAAEREAVKDEPSLARAAEIVGRQLLTGPREIPGRFTVRRDRRHRSAAPVWVARWAGESTSTREDITALEDLALYAREMGLRASRLGFEVIATLPPADGPSLAKAAPRTTLRAA